MHLRPATNKDLPRIVDIVIEGNRNDTLARYISRDTSKYPLSYRWGCYRYMRGEILNPGALAFVVETDPSDFPGEDAATAPKVVGWAVWTRNGNSDAAKEWRRKVNGGWLDALNRKLGSLESLYGKTFQNVNRTFNHERFNVLMQDVMSESWDNELLKDFWELNGLFVDPPWQKRGLGRILIDWGKGKATEEGVPIVVHGSAIGGLAYRRYGFHSVGATAFGEYFDEVEYGGEVMQNWVWVPEGKGLDDVPTKVREKREKMLLKKKEEKTTRK